LLLLFDEDADTVHAFDEALKQVNFLSQLKVGGDDPA
jgi:hypothetical protein